MSQADLKAYKRMMKVKSNCRRTMKAKNRLKSERHERKSAITSRRSLTWLSSEVYKFSVQKGTEAERLLYNAAYIEQIEYFTCPLRIRRRPKINDEAHSETAKVILSSKEGKRWSADSRH